MREGERGREIEPKSRTVIPIRSRRNLASMHQSKQQTWIEEQELNWVEGAVGGGLNPITKQSRNKRKWRRGNHQRRDHTEWNTKRRLMRSKFRTTYKSLPHLSPLKSPRSEENIKGDQKTNQRTKTKALTNTQQHFKPQLKPNIKMKTPIKNKHNLTKKQINKIRKTCTSTKRNNSRNNTNKHFIKTNKPPNTLNKKSTNSKNLELMK